MPTRAVSTAFFIWMAACSVCSACSLLMARYRLPSGALPKPSTEKSSVRPERLVKSRRSGGFGSVWVTSESFRKGSAACVGSGLSTTRLREGVEGNGQHYDDADNDLLDVRRYIHQHQASGTPIRMLPMTIPKIDPAPPNRLVPPITTDAMTVNS